MLNDLVQNLENGESHSQIPQGIINALFRLHDAAELASRFDLDPWQFAVELKTFQAEGTTANNCRQLVIEGLIEHAHEISLDADTMRSFRGANGTCFSGRTCFILSATGRPIAEKLVELQLSKPVRQNSPATKPHWDDEKRELYYGETLVKKFKLPAPNQRAVLVAFEEENWPGRIDDPLPPKSGIESKRRLHDTINSLNRNQKKFLVHFSGDGSGAGICWEPT